MIARTCSWKRKAVSGLKSNAAAVTRDVNPSTYWPFSMASVKAAARCVRFHDCSLSLVLGLSPS
jgi:hypothetical protein